MPETEAAKPEVASPWDQMVSFLRAVTLVKAAVKKVLSISKLSF
jgi:hypothetical protein